MTNWRDYFKNLPLNLVGVGVTAFNRCLPAFFVSKYRIVCAKDSLDLSEIAKKCPIVATERDFPKGVERLNSLAILKHPGIQNYLHHLAGPIGIFLYKSTARVERVCDESGWQVIGNRAAIRDPFENKQVFRETLKKVGIKPITGETINLAAFDETLLVKMQQKYGCQLVLKLPEIAKGGGMGLSFVHSKADLPKFWQKIKQLGTTHKLKNLIVEKKIEAISSSITGCVTRFGILTGLVQTQIVDIPEVMDVSRGAGMFAGHDWSYCHYSSQIQHQAERICRRFGEHLHQKGYRGVFGLDLLVDQKTDKVYACECNPRFTGAFPVYAMMQLASGEIPFDAFHLLEHLKVDYQMNFDKVQQTYRQPKEGAQLIIHNPYHYWVQVQKTLLAGVYRLNRLGKLEYLRPGFSFLDIQDGEEFVLTDGVPRKGTKIKPNLRILKIIFPSQILSRDGRRLNEKTRLIVKAIYHKINLSGCLTKLKKKEGKNNRQQSQHQNKNS